MVELYTMYIPMCYPPVFYSFIHLVLIMLCSDLGVFLIGMLGFFFPFLFYFFLKQTCWVCIMLNFFCLFHVFKISFASVDIYYYSHHKVWLTQFGSLLLLIRHNIISCVWWYVIPWFLCCWLLFILFLNYYRQCKFY